MGEVVVLDGRRDLRRAGAAARGPAEIHLFTGVRYERRADETAPAPATTPGSPARPTRRKRRRTS